MTLPEPHPKASAAFTPSCHTLSHALPQLPLVLATMLSCSTSNSVLVSWPEMGSDQYSVTARGTH